MFSFIRQCNTVVLMQVGEMRGVWFDRPPHWIEHFRLNFSFPHPSLFFAPLTHSCWLSFGVSIFWWSSWVATSGRWTRDDRTPEDRMKVGDVIRLKSHTLVSKSPYCGHYQKSSQLSFDPKVIEPPGRLLTGSYLLVPAWRIPTRSLRKTPEFAFEIFHEASLSHGLAWCFYGTHRSPFVG